VFKSEAKETHMAITLFAVGALIAPLHQLLGGFCRNRAPRQAPRAGRPFQPAPVRSAAERAAPLAGAHSRTLRPLRVVRVAEPWRGPAGAGRMVISGRMADVCAELDRLADLEAGAASP
jgi:hypothetical protein